MLGRSVQSREVKPWLGRSVEAEEARVTMSRPVKATAEGGENEKGDSRTAPHEPPQRTA
jgi:hypothetical protein